MSEFLLCELAFSPFRLDDELKFLPLTRCYCYSPLIMIWHCHLPYYTSIILSCETCKKVILTKILASRDDNIIYEHAK